MSLTTPRGHSLPPDWAQKKGPDPKNQAQLPVPAQHYQHTYTFWKTLSWLETLQWEDPGCLCPLPHPDSHGQFPVQTHHWPHNGGCTDAEML